MPDRVRYVMRKDETYDAYVRDLVAERGYGRERTYAGVADQDQADSIRRKLRQAGKHLGVSVKAFWEPCGSDRCPAGTGCKYHVRYSAYRREDAKAYKERIAKRPSFAAPARKRNP